MIPHNRIDVSISIISSVWFIIPAFHAVEISAVFCGESGRVVHSYCLGSFSFVLKLSLLRAVQRARFQSLRRHIVRDTDAASGRTLAAVRIPPAMALISCVWHLQYLIALAGESVRARARGGKRDWFQDAIVVVVLIKRNAGAMEIYCAFAAAAGTIPIMNLWDMADTSSLARNRDNRESIALAVSNDVISVHHSLRAIVWNDDCGRRFWCHCSPLLLLSSLEAERKRRRARRRRRLSVSLQVSSRLVALQQDHLFFFGGGGSIVILGLPSAPQSLAEAHKKEEEEEEVIWCVLRHCATLCLYTLET